MRVHIPKECTRAGCKAVVLDGSTRCALHPLERAKRPHSTSKNASFYNSRAWKNLSYRKRISNALCEQCLHRSVYKQADIVDHIVEIKDDYTKRLEWSNLQSLCYSCHSIKTHAARKARKATQVQGYALLKQIRGNK